MPIPDLLPCPFCGSPARIVEWTTGKPQVDLFDEQPETYSVECTSCTAHLFADGEAKTPFEAASAWNRRAV